MSENYDTLTGKLDAAIAHFVGKGGKADTIILPPVDFQLLASSPQLTAEELRGRPVWRYAGVRIMEGKAFDFGRVEGHDYRSWPSEYLI